MAYARFDGESDVYVYYSGALDGSYDRWVVQRTCGCEWHTHSLEALWEVLDSIQEDNGHVPDECWLRIEWEMGHGVHMIGAREGLPLRVKLSNLDIMGVERN